MKSIFSALCFLLCISAEAQQVIDVSKTDVNVGQNLFYSVGGTPFVNAKFVSLMEGTPYFKDEWMKGVVITGTGGEYKNISLKLDLYDNELHYLDKDGKEFIATSPVKEVVLTDASEVNYRFIHSSSLAEPGAYLKKGWYMWLGSGKASLYKSFKKDLSENKPYGSATAEQRIKTIETYLVEINKNFIEVKKLKDLPGVLANKKAELEEFLKTKDDKQLSMDERFAAAIDHYNSFFTENK